MQMIMSSLTDQIFEGSTFDFGSTKVFQPVRSLPLKSGVQSSAAGEPPAVRTSTASTATPAKGSTRRIMGETPVGEKRIFRARILLARGAGMKCFLSRVRLSDAGATPSSRRNGAGTG